jgi:hypothetical protein
VVLILGSTLLAVACIAAFAVSTQRRSRKIQSIARSVGLSFELTAMPFEGTNVEGLTILHDGSATVVANALKSLMDNCPSLMFDLTSYCEEITFVTTIAAFRSPSRYLPSFHIAPKCLFDKVEEALGRHHVHFDTDPDFTNAFCIDTADLAGTRTFLNHAKLEYLRLHACPFRIESSPDWLLIYHPGHQVSHAQLQQFAIHTAELASALLADPPAIRQVA